MSHIAVPIWACTGLGKSLFSLILIAETGMEPLYLLCGL